MQKCRKCSVQLGENNWSQSFQSNNNKICSNCANNYSSSRKKVVYQALKREIFQKLGNKCNCPKCNVDDYLVLSIDHIHGGGAQEKKIHKGTSYLKKLNNLSLDELKRNYQLLCFNCNYSKGYYGICAHLL